jgi:hypothetical protein
MFPIIAAKIAGPTARLPAPDRLQGLSLRLVGALVQEERHVDLGTGPDVALEHAERHQVQSVEPHVAEVSVADVPGEDALAPRTVGSMGRAV